MSTAKIALPEAPAALPDVVRIERLLPHPPRRIWRALTEKDAIEKWLLPIAPSKESSRAARLAAPGDSVTLRPEPALRIAYEVAEAEPEQYLSLWWRVRSSDTDETVTTRVTWTLTPEQDGAATRLVVEHRPVGVTAPAAGVSAPLSGVMARFAVYLELGRTYRRTGGRGTARSIKEKIRCQ
jgi:uncharacterized protein YndB with AHSA1/START domain